MRFVMMRSNIQELPQFMEFAAELNAEVVYLTHVVPYDRLGTISESLQANSDGFNEYVDRSMMLAEQAGIHAVLPRTRQVGINVTGHKRPARKHDSHHLADIDQGRESHGLPKRLARDEAKSCCPFPWHFMAIDPDGSVFPCGWWHSGPPMGNLYTQSFQEIWSGEPMQRLRSQLVSRQLGANCSRCPAAGMGASDSSVSYQSR